MTDASADTSVLVFISYSRTDSAFVDRLEADLRAYGFDTWVDRQHLEGGADWARLIEQQITRCEVLVVGLSPDAIASTWVRREITFALNAGKHIIPIIVRPVERIPIDIVEKQYIYLGANYASGLQDLRVALLKVRTLPPPPRPAQSSQPLLTLPDVSDPLNGLVQIPAPPPAPNPDLNTTFMQAQSALAHNNLDLTEALLRQIVEQEEDFGSGLAAEELAKVRKQLEPVQIQRLRAMADDAHAHGAFGQEIGALRALASRLPDDDAIANRLALAEDCQKWAWLYDNARGFVQACDAAAATVALNQLWERAPYFGDPLRIAPSGLTPPHLSGSQVGAWRYSTLEQGYTFVRLAVHSGLISALRWSPDGRRIVSGGNDKAARVANAQSGEALFTFTAHATPVHDVAWSPDSQIVASGGMDGTVRVWRARDGGTLFTFYLSTAGGMNGRTYVRTVDWAPAGNSVIAGGLVYIDEKHTQAVCAEWNTSTGALSWSALPARSNSSRSELIAIMRYSPDGKWIALSSGGNTLIRPIANPREGGTQIGSTQIIALAWSPDSIGIARGLEQRAFSVVRPSGTWSGGAKVIQAFACGGHTGQVRALAWSPDGSRIASASDDGVRLWDATNGKLLFAYGEHKAPVTALCWSPDSTRIASGDSSGALRIWKA